MFIQKCRKVFYFEVKIGLILLCFNMDSPLDRNLCFCYYTTYWGLILFLCYSYGLFCLM